MKHIQRTAQRTLILLLGGGLAVAAAAQTSVSERVNAAPEGFVAPPLHPDGSRLETKQLAPGVYALLSDKPPVDNSGFVVGERGVLVIDAHINGAMARQIQAAVRAVTDKPILYLVNTNYHGDHTFGNYAFSAETRIIAHRKTAERMREFEQEKQFLMRTVNNDPAVFADVKLRLPDQVFDQHLRLDLGGRVVELYHFGPGNTPGDTVVYVPEAKVAWTGNLVLGEGTIPFLIEGGAGDYRQTIARFARALEVTTIVPGHGPLTSGPILDRYVRYLGELTESVGKATRAGQSLEEALASVSLGEAYAPAPASPLAGLVAGVHRWNVQQTYQELKRR
jgi:cyclase